MNREIKFRGKHVDTKEWMYGYLVNWLQSYGSKVCGIIENGGGFGMTFHIVEPESVGQFTGFYDAGKRELWEGDIIEDDAVFYRIGWDEDGMWIAYDIVTGENVALYEFNDTSTCWLQGNALDHPELLIPTRS